ncbi:MAG TPA: alanine racemase [Tepidisphaeraceae bacterium]|jgi:D-serine deaminase-like pyridoxal phosphate-dependent protein
MMTEETVPTPALIVDLEIVEQNLSRAHQYAAKHGIKVRPHTKTHKSLYMAQRQLAHGAKGLTVAKFGEAMVMGEVCDDLLLAYPYIDPNRLPDVMELAKKKKIRFSFDNPQAIDILGESAAWAGLTLDVMVDVDAGHHRTGVQTAVNVLELAQRVAKHKSLRFEGVFCYPGHLNNVKAAEQRMPEVSAILRECIALLKKSGIEARTISGGSTPTLFYSHLAPEITEIRPGTYIYNDRNEIAAGIAAIEQCATRLLSTVVSDAVPNKFVLNSGSKSLTNDRLGMDPINGGFGLVVEYPKAKVSRLSEEHGEVEVNDGEKPKVGERVHVIPNHVCPCVNLHDFVWFKHKDGSLEKMPVDARGKTT